MVAFGGSGGGNIGRGATFGGSGGGRSREVTVWETLLSHIVPLAGGVVEVV